MVLSFSDFELDEDLYELRRGGQVVKVEPKAFDMLAYLIHNRNRVVSKDELLEKLWPGEFVSESALSYCIKAARKAVDDPGSAQRIIKTFHGRGFRFIAEVREAGAGAVSQGVIAPAAEAAVPLAERAGPVFVGRRFELTQLEAALDQALKGRGRLVMLVGEPGIGKTRTAEQLAARARGRGARVLIGRCYEGEGAPSFWPWVQVVRSYVHDCAPEALRAQMGAGAQDIAQLVPAVARRLPGLPPAPPLEPEQARFRLFDSVTSFIKNAAEAQPLVLILDDLHWADKASLLLLQFLTREMGSAHLLVLGCYRDVEVHRSVPLAEIAAALRRELLYDRILLRGLSEEDVRALLGAIAEQDLPDPFVRAIFNETEGNPFFTQEILRHLIEEGILYRDGLRWTSDLTPEQMGIPEGVREVIWRRLARLSDACRRVLTVAAVIGREFELAALARIWEREQGDGAAAREHVLALLDEAAAARIIEKAPRTLGQYRFSHALIRETLNDELATHERVRLHRDVGEALEVIWGADIEPHLTELAHHFVQAAPGGDVDKAIDYAVRAAEHATASLGYEEAVDHYEMALQAMQLKEEPDEVRRAELLLALGEEQWRAGDTLKAKETFLRAANSAKAIGASELLARAAMGFGRPLRTTGTVDETFVALLEDALVVLGDADSALRARTLARLAWALYAAPGSYARRQTLARDAVAMARRLGDDSTLAWTLHDSHWATWGPANLSERLAAAGELIKLAGQIGSREMVLHGHVLRTADLLEMGDLAAVDSEIEAYACLADELRQPWHHWYVLRFRTMRALLEGSFELAERLARQAHAVGERVDAYASELVFAWQTTALHLQQGRRSELEAGVRGRLDQYPALASWRCALAVALEPDAARREVDVLAENGFSDLPTDIFWLAAVSLLAQSCAALGDQRRAAWLYDMLLPYQSGCVAVGVGYVCLGSTAHYLGLLASALLRWDEATHHFENAIAAHTRMQARSWLAESRFHYARMLLRRNRSKDRTQAREFLDAALETARSAGMTGLAEQAQALRGAKLSRARRS